jgi:transposase
MTVTTQPSQRDPGPDLAAGIFVGVDTHQLTHHVAILDAGDRVLADAEFPVSAAGYAAMTTWLSRYGTPVAVGVESTGGYGAGLTRHLLAAGLHVFEVDRPERATRAREGKSDPIDAIAAARAVRTGRADGLPKIHTGAVESLRMHMIPRESAVKDRTRAYSQLRDLVTTAPDDLHDQLIGLSGPARVKIAAGFRPDPARLDEPTQAAKQAMRRLARRIQVLDIEIAEADQVIDRLTATLVPTLRAMRQIGPHTAAQLVVTAGENIERLRSEAAFAKLCGVAPLPAGSGKNPNRHRLNRGGDRQANRALYLIVVGRMKNHPQTRAYLERRMAQNLKKPDIIRCLKRHLARSVYRALRDDLLTT